MKRGAVLILVLLTVACGQQNTKMKIGKGVKTEDKSKKVVEDYFKPFYYAKEIKDGKVIEHFLRSDCFQAKAGSSFIVDLQLREGQPYQAKISKFSAGKSPSCALPAEVPFDSVQIWTIGTKAITLNNLGILLPNNDTPSLIFNSNFHYPELAKVKVDLKKIDVASVEKN